MESTPPFPQPQQQHHDHPSIEHDFSDCESGVSATTSNQQQQQQKQIGQDSYLVRLKEGEALHDLIKTRFLSGLGLLSNQTQIIAIHRNACNDVVSQARLHSFQIYSQAVSKLRHGDSNVKYAWYGTSGENDVRDILSNGFSHVHGHNLCLSPDNSPLSSVKRCGVGRDGVGHLILCRVILGRTEIVKSDTNQCYPCCEDYDSGVDSFSAPTKYFIWSSNMNTHVWPAYVISFKEIKMSEEENVGMRPTSPWMPFPALISMLSKALPQLDIDMITKLYKAKNERKISRNKLIQKLRQIAGDKLLISIIKSYRAKKKPTSFLQTKLKNI